MASENKLILKGLGYALLSLFFPIIAGIIISVFQPSHDIYVYYIQGAGFTLSIIMGIVLMNKSNYSFKEYGFTIGHSKSYRHVLWFLPILCVEILSLQSGFKDDLELTYLITVLIFTLLVSINEEIYFRGLVLKILSKKGVRFSVALSSLIFGVLHITNLMNDADPIYLLLQIIFASVFGLTCALLVIKTKSIVGVIIWHFLHNTIAYVSTDEMTKESIIGLALVCLILILYSIYMFKSIPKND